MRLPATRNRTLLCLNILLFALLVSTVLMLSGRLDFSRAAHSLPPKIAALGMEVYWEKGPFVLLTAKDFPRAESFLLLQPGRPLSIFARDAGTPAVNGAAAKSVSVYLGDDFSLECDYSAAGAVQQLMLCRRKKGVAEALTDLNADGVFDLRSTRDDRRGVSCLYVLYHGVWREVMGGDKDPRQDKYHKRLATGEYVSFSIESGQWAPAGRPAGTGKGVRNH